MKDRPLPAEFELIERFFAPLAKDYPGALALADDGALIELDPGHRLVVTTDVLVAGVHFPAADPPESIARKLLRVNLSDLAAMGSEDSDRQVVVTGVHVLTRGCFVFVDRLRDFAPGSLGLRAGSQTEKDKSNEGQETRHGGKNAKGYCIGFGARLPAGSLTSVQLAGTPTKHTTPTTRNNRPKSASASRGPSDRTAHA
ncbi:MAG: hypothetical protein IH926_11150, partial [Proteobacteria bacterium]|nr:hypothetical protein [Pseudomonadota bacterium]